MKKNKTYEAMARSDIYEREQEFLENLEEEIRKVKSVELGKVEAMADQVESLRVQKDLYRELEARPYLKASVKEHVSRRRAEAEANFTAATRRLQAAQGDSNYLNAKAQTEDHEALRDAIQDLFSEFRPGYKAPDADPPTDPDA